MTKSKKNMSKLATINPVAGIQEFSNEPLTATQQIQSMCENHMHRYVLAHTHDGWCIDGIVEFVDANYVCLAVPAGGTHGWDNRAFVPFGRPGLYPYPYYPRRRFYRQILPLGLLLGLTLLPFF